MNYRQKILDAAIALAADGGLQYLTRDGVARVAGVGAGTVNKHFGTIVVLRSDVVREAVRIENLDVLAQGLALGFVAARNAPARLKRRALALLGAL